jgi:diguanylate cyclase (GGDEF)-like protein
MELIHPDDLERTLEVGGWAQGEINHFENRYLCKDGSWRSLVWTAHKDGDVWYAAARDVTERETLERHALHDSLTGLPNRLLFSDRTQQALARLERKDAPLALLWVDLDRLKLVNDGFGHELGDRLLRAVADRLREELREADTIARFGGDEFAVLVEDLVDETAALRVGDRIVAALSKSFAIEGEEISIGASVGITFTRASDRGEHDLLREADVAMYRVKAGGGGGCALFDTDMRRAAVARVRIERELRHALQGREFCLVYQPSYRSATARRLPARPCSAGSLTAE